MQLFFVVFRGSLFDLDLDLLGAALDVVGSALTVDDSGAVLGGLDAAGLTQVGDSRLVQAAAGLFGDHLASGEHGDIFQHGLAPVTEAWGFQRQTVQGAAQPVDHQYGQGFAVDVLADDHQALADLEDLLQERDQFGGGGDFLVGYEDIGVLDNGFHTFRVGDEVGADVAAVEVHAVDIFCLGLDPFALFDGDNALRTNLVQHVGQHVSDLFVVG